MESRPSGSRGISLRSILIHSFWTTLTGILFFCLATTNGHNFAYIHFFAISGTLLVTLPWIIQLLISTTVIFLHKTKGYHLMWIVQSPTISKEVVDHTTTKVGTCSPSSSPQVLGETDAEEIAIRIVIEGRNKTKLLPNGSV